MKTKIKKNKRKKTRKTKGSGPKQSKPTEEDFGLCEIPLEEVFGFFPNTLSPLSEPSPIISGTLDTGYIVVDMSTESNLVKYSTMIAESYTTTRPLKSDHWSLKTIDTRDHFHFFNTIQNKNYVKVEPRIYINAFRAAVEVLNIYGFTTNLSDPGKINIVYTNADTSNVTSGFSAHCDNQGYQVKRINSLVVYVDVDCSGGELEIHKDGPLFGNPHIEDTVSPIPSSPDTRKVVLLEGNKFHYPKPVTKGKRIAVVYNIKQ